MTAFAFGLDGGVVGTAHHWYFNGEPAAVLALGAFFSAFEVIPLTFLTVEAWSFLQLGAAQQSRSQTPFPHRWAVMFLVAVGFWNFLGAGIFGFLINLPIVSYFEVGTVLTPNHGHAAGPPRARRHDEQDEEDGGEAGEDGQRGHRLRVAGGHELRAAPREILGDATAALRGHDDGDRDEGGVRAEPGLLQSRRRHAVTMPGWLPRG